jgi:hypothetical protein
MCSHAERGNKENMQFINSLEQALAYLENKYLLVKVTHDHTGLTTKQRITGKLMGLMAQDWWYVVIDRDQTTLTAMLDRQHFDELFRNYYICRLAITSETGFESYTLNKVCEIQEIPRHRHRIKSWQEMISTPSKPQGSTLKQLSSCIPTHCLPVLQLPNN